MTVEEMRDKIDKKCNKYRICSDGCELYKAFDYCPNERIEDDETVKEMYDIMFGKKESEMKNEFDFNELKAGYAIKVPAYGEELLVGIPHAEDLIFYSKDFNNVVGKKEIVNNKTLKEYIPIEVYGFSYNGNLFDASTRPLLYKLEDKNQKVYKMGNLIIEPNYRLGYNYEDTEGGIYISQVGDFGVTIKKSELNDVINALTEIRDFVKEEE